MEIKTKYNIGDVIAFNYSQENGEAFAIKDGRTYSGFGIIVEIIFDDSGESLTKPKYRVLNYQSHIKENNITGRFKLEVPE